MNFEMWALTLKIRNEELKASGYESADELSRAIWHNVWIRGYHHEDKLQLVITSTDFEPSLPTEVGGVWRFEDGDVSISIRRIRVGSAPSPSPPARMCSEPGAPRNPPTDPLTRS